MKEDQYLQTVIRDGDYVINLKRGNLVDKRWEFDNEADFNKKWNRVRGKFILQRLDKWDVLYRKDYTTWRVRKVTKKHVTIWNMRKRQTITKSRVMLAKEGWMMMGEFNLDNAIVREIRECTEFLRERKLTDKDPMPIHMYNRYRGSIKYRGREYPCLVETISFNNKMVIVRLLHKLTEKLRDGSTVNMDTDEFGKRFRLERHYLEFADEFVPKSIK